MAKFEDLTGQQFGRLTAIEHRSSPRGTIWTCKCTCGNICYTNCNSLKKGLKQSCGCLLDEWRKSKHTDLIGKRFGKLTVIAPAESANRRKPRFLCRCDCGNEIVTRKDGLLDGHTRSCGCVHPGNKKHGLTYDRAYWVWAKIKARCYNPNSREYYRYGGAGIKMCDEWLDPKNFVEWAYANGYDATAPKGQCTCDRIDPRGNYEPSNCRWITNLEQQNNRKYHVRAEYKGETHTASEWSRILGIPYTTVACAIKRGKGIEYLINDYVPRNRN